MKKYLKVLWLIIFQISLRTINPQTQEAQYHTRIRIRKKKYKKAKWLSEEALQIAEKRREAQGKGKIPKVMLKILQARLQLHVNRELPDVQAGFRQKQRNQRSNSQHPLDH